MEHNRYHVSVIILLWCVAFLIACLYMHSRSKYSFEMWGLEPINQLKPVTFFGLSQARTWISNAICRGHLFV